MQGRRMRGAWGEVHWKRTKGAWEAWAAHGRHMGSVWGEIGRGYNNTAFMGLHWEA
jgi:hypothetical protein